MTLPLVDRSVTMRALIITAPGQAKVVDDRPIPALRAKHVLVKVICVALNHADWRAVDYFSVPGAVLGYDYSGIVEDVGEGVTRFRRGDHICGLVHGGNANDLEEGTFAEYTVAKEHVQIHIPKGLSFQEAATLGVGTGTVGLALYQSLKLKLPNDPVDESKSVLIYGGSTATGSLAIQFAKLSGYQVFTTCSPHNFDLVKSLGTNAVLDYKELGCAAEIRKLTNNRLQVALDTISDEASAQFCAEALSSDGGAYASLLPVTAPGSGVNSSLVLGYTSFGEPFQLGSHSFEAVPADSQFAAWWMPFAGDLMSSGKVRVHSHMVGKNGLEGILEGLDLLRKGMVSGRKLVYNISEVPT